MEPSYKHLDKETLNALLDIQRQNLGVLEVQAAKHGSAQVPLVIVHGIREAKNGIEAIEKELHRQEPNATPEKSKPKILIIDDDSTFREEILEMLSDDDFVLMESPNGIEGLKLAEAEQPDIILLDIEMPDMNGHTVLAQIVERRIQTRVLIISAYDNRVSTLIRAGACDFISKIDANKAGLKVAIQRSLLLDYTVDVILDNPTKLINPLIERLELSYQREVLLKSELKELVRDIKSHVDMSRKDGTDNKASGMIARIEADVNRIDIEKLENSADDSRRTLHYIMHDIHNLGHETQRAKRIISVMSKYTQGNYKQGHLDELKRYIDAIDKIVARIHERSIAILRDL